MNTKHTPGPWAVNHETDITGTENDPQNGCMGPVDVAHVYMRTVPGRTEANARLISSAPDLLEALTELLADYDNGVTDAESALLAKCRAAIAKAVGGAA